MLLNPVRQPRRRRIDIASRASHRTLLEPFTSRGRNGQRIGASDRHVAYPEVGDRATASCSAAPTPRCTTRSTVGGPTIRIATYHPDDGRGRAPPRPARRRVQEGPRARRPATWSTSRIVSVASGEVVGASRRCCAGPTTRSGVVNTATILELAEIERAASTSSMPGSSRLPSSSISRLSHRSPTSEFFTDRRQRLAVGARLAEKLLANMRRRPPDDRSYPCIECSRSSSASASSRTARSSLANVRRYRRRWARSAGARRLRGGSHVAGAPARPADQPAEARPMCSSSRPSTSDSRSHHSGIRRRVGPRARLHRRRRGHRDRLSTRRWQVDRGRRRPPAGVRPVPTHAPESISSTLLQRSGKVATVLEPPAPSRAATRG